MRIKSLLFCLGLGTPALADGNSIGQAFDDAQAAMPSYALGLIYAAPGTTNVMAAGPIHKGAEAQVDAQALWHIGSISKSFTATLVMQHVERGTLSLDVPISTYLGTDGIDPGWQSLTLRQILSHTAGLRRNPSIRQLLSTPNEPTRDTRRQILESFWGDPPARAPGGYDYSNLGFLLAGVILEEVSDTPWEELVLRDIADPLGLSTLGFGAPQGETTPWGHKSIVVARRAVAPDAPRSDNPAWLGPAGTLHMSLTDLARWGNAHLEACKGQKPGFLSAESCKTMMTPVAPNYGLGWIIEPDDGLVWHNGSNNMWYAQLMLHPESGAMVAVTHNTSQSMEANALSRAILKSLIDTQAP